MKTKTLPIGNKAHEYNVIYTRNVTLDGQQFNPVFLKP